VFDEGIVKLWVVYERHDGVPVHASMTGYPDDALLSQWLRLLDSI
jgi:hypothetical protein